MKVALDVSPISSAHAYRGVGTYTKNLKDSLVKLNLDLVTIGEPSESPLVDVFHFPYFDLFQNTLKPRKNSKNVVTIHDVIPLVFPEHFPRGIRGNLRLLLQKKALQQVDAIICDSQTSKADIVAKLGVEADKVHVIYLAAAEVFKPISNTKELSEITNRFKLPQKFVLFVGDVNWNKNILGLLEAIHIANVNLVLVGKALKDENLSQVVEINNTIKKLNLQTKIQKLGYVSDLDLVKIYNLAEATIVPSHYEGFGLPVIESMACGTPVICANNSSLAEIGKNAAVFCNSHDPKDISDKIRYVMQASKDQKLKLSKKGRDRSRNFSWTKVAQQTIDVYKSVLVK